MEHCKITDKTLYSMELTGVTISVPKTTFMAPAINIVGYVCDFNGRHQKLQKSLLFCGSADPGLMRRGQRVLRHNF